MVVERKKNDEKDTHTQKSTNESKNNRNVLSLHPARRSIHSHFVLLIESQEKKMNNL